MHDQVPLQDHFPWMLDAVDSSGFPQVLWISPKIGGKNSKWQRGFTCCIISQQQNCESTFSTVTVQY